MEQEFRDHVCGMPEEGVRLKKFRQGVMQKFLGERQESDLKKEFAVILQTFTDNGTVSVDGGFVKREQAMEAAPAASNRKRKPVGEPEPDEEEMSPMHIAITEALNELTEAVRLKKFRKTVMSHFQNVDEEKLKADFAAGFEEFCARGDVKEEDGMVTRLCDIKAIRKPKKKVLERVDAAEAKKELWKYGEQTWADGSLDQDYLTENPDGITRLFCGNLKISITEDELHNAIPGITHIKWMTDKVTREFYGSTFIEMKDPKAAAAAVLMDKTKLLGRPLKIYYCPPRPGDIWPPENNPRGGGASGNSAPRSARNIRPKPQGCRKLFCGNLAYEIDDDVICNFFNDCGTLTGLRWITREGTGEFRGCAFVEFGTTAEADKAILKNGEILLSSFPTIPKLEHIQKLRKLWAPPACFEIPITKLTSPDSIYLPIMQGRCMKGCLCRHACSRIRPTLLMRGHDATSPARWEFRMNPWRHRATGHPTSWLIPSLSGNTIETPPFLVGNSITQDYAWAGNGREESYECSLDE